MSTHWAVHIRRKCPSEKATSDEEAMHPYLANAAACSRIVLENCQALAGDNVEKAQAKQRENHKYPLKCTRWLTVCHVARTA